MIRRLDELEKLVRERRDPTPPSEPARNPEPQDSHYTNEPTENENDPDISAFLSTLWGPPEIPIPQPPPLSQSSPLVADVTGVQWSPSSGKPLTGSQNNDEFSTIPIGHLTPTSSLFSLDQIKRLIGEYPEDFFFQIESTRYLDTPQPEGELYFEKSHSDALTSAFFAEIHPHFPILDPQSFGTFFNEIMFDGGGDESSRALCMIVLALGKLASNRQASSPGQYTDDDGIEYFARAYHRLTSQWLTSFNFNIPLASGLVYCAIYLCYLERPLHAWRLIYMASSKVQILASQ